MQSGINTPSSLKIPSERLDTISCATDTKSFCDKSEYDQILNDIVGIETPQRFKDRLQKHYVEPPSSNKKNNQITTKEPMEYIFAENQSSIYYTENLDNESCSQFGSESIKKCQSTNKMKECIVENDKSQKSLLASHKSEQQSRTSSTKNFITNEKMNEVDNFEERSLCLLEKDSLSNGVIIDPVRVHEEKPFIVVSVLNDISGRKKSDHEVSSRMNTTTTSLASASKQGEDSLIMMKCQEELKQSEMQINGLRNLKNQVSDFMSSLNQHRVKINQKMKEEERVSRVPPPSKNETITQEIIEVPVESNQGYPELSRKQDNTIEDVIYTRKKEELDRINRQLLEGDAIAENASESGQYHPFMKKTLSVIFSTNESIETNSHRGSGKNLGPGIFIKESDAFLHSQGRTNSRILMTQDSDSLKNKENIAVSGEKEGFMTVTASSVGTEDENLVNFVQTMRFHNKDNKELVGKLGKIIDLYNRQIEKYEMNNKVLREKNKKYSQGNELLIKTLKAFEKEMDKLVANNQTLHKNIIFLQEEIKGYEMKQSSLKEVVMQQETMMNKLKEELKSKLAENEDFKCKLALRDTKIESLNMDIQSCEDSMSRVSQILKETLTQKKSKITSKNLYTAFETIYAEIANFADNLNSNSKLRNSKNAILGARKDSGPIRPEEYLAYYDNNELQSRKRDTKPIKNVSKSIDLSSSWKGSTYPSLLSQRAVINRHRQHSLVESSVFDNEYTYKELATRGRSRQVSSEKTKPRLDRSAPVRDSQSNNKPSVRTNKYALEADVEENLRKMLISNLRATKSKYAQ